MIKKIVKISFSSLLILSLFACSFNKQAVFKQKTLETASYGMTNGFSRKAVLNAPAMVDYAVEETAEYDDGASVGSEKKLIKTVDISSETKEFDKTISWLKSHVESFDGIIDNSYIDSGNKVDPNYRKNAHFSVRVPADKLDTFLASIGDNLSITFEQESIRDVTDAYDDTESRKKTLLIEEEKLNELLKKAKTVDELVSVESKLSEVRYELQNIENRLKRYDRQIDYSTVNISIQEVREITVEVEKENYSKENLLKMLNKNFEDTKKFIVRTGVWIFTHIPAICLGLAGVIVLLVIVLIIKSLVKKKRKSVKK